MCEEYNGWTNRETWLVGLWDFFDYAYIAEAIDNIIENPNTKTGRHDKSQWSRTGVLHFYIIQLADFMEVQHQEFVDEEIEKLSPYIRDFISVGKIDWLSIAEHYEDDIKDAIILYRRSNKDLARTYLKQSRSERYHTN